MHVIIHYAEIGTKGSNRPFFERKLAENIQHLAGISVERRFGRLVAEAKRTKKIEGALSSVPGIANFSFAESCKSDVKAMEKKLAGAAKRMKFRTFRITASRSDKSFPMNSMELNRKLAGVIWKMKKKVDLEEPEAEFFVEVGKERTFIYTEKIPGTGGVPVGTAGKAVCLISGGIDSPVSAFRMMKRGCRIVFVHFYTQKDGKKIADIVKVLKKFQGRSKIYFIPFRDAQNEIIVLVPDRYRMILYRRMMLRIAEEILERERAKAFVTGDSLSQVASQTMHNLRCIYTASTYPVLAPLIGMDKQEIVDEAKRIGTYEASIRKYHDCCAFMVAKHPETRASLADVEDIEKKIDIDSLVSRALKRKEVVKV
ncbi:MAG: tRNA 4-thiouridine(8) synthase ThiI [Candidatus Aenigmarchaeota archaeon]|nr:tRNA 4-thiouridine(8) synthase ThiI [Candidatus Aenigmarchaeota archaeon]